MKFSITREAFLQPLQVVAPLVETKATLPILSNIFFRLEHQHLECISTDSEVELRAHCQVTAAKAPEPFEVTVPGRKLMDICRGLPSGTQIDFAFEGNKLTLKTRAGRYVLLTLPAEDFPRIEQRPSDIEFTIQQQSLYQLLEFTHFAVALQDVRYYLNGLFIDIDSGQMTAVGTDGHRLATSHTTLSPNLPKTQILLPRKAIMELMRLMEPNEDEIVCNIGSNFARLHSDQFAFTTKLIEGRFPDYKKVIPQRGGSSITVERTELKEALARVAILSNQQFRGVRLRSEDNQLSLFTQNAESGEAEEVLNVTVEGEPLSVGVNIQYLVDVLNVLPCDFIKIYYEGSGTSIVLEGVGIPHSEYVIMPMRI